MNKKVILGLALGLLLLASVAIWLHEPEKPHSASAQVAGSAKALPIETLPVPEPSPVVASVPEVEERPAEERRGPTREEAFPTSPGASAGYYTKYMTVDFEIYLQFLDIGAYSEIVDGKMASEALVQNIKAQYQLTDEQLEQFIETGRSALQADRAFQAEGMRAVCKKGDAFASVEELGAALDGLNKKAEANQEELGRKAMQELEPELALKIRNKILGAARREMLTGDLAIVMPMRNHGLETELERVCKHAESL